MLQARSLRPAQRVGTGAEGLLAGGFSLGEGGGSYGAQVELQARGSCKQGEEGAGWGSAGWQSGGRAGRVGSLEGRWPGGGPGGPGGGLIGWCEQDGRSVYMPKMCVYQWRKGAIF